MTTTGNPPHLTLAELAASGGTRPLPPAAAAHLEACAACRARSREAVADGVRFLVAGCQPPPGLLGSVFDAIDTQPAPARHGWLAGRGHPRWPAVRGHRGVRRVALAAAAAVLLAATGAGLATALGPAGQPDGAAEAGGSAIAHAGLTLTECSGLRLQVLGRTLQRVNGTSLVLAGQLTATTSAGTEILREVTGTAADVTDGAQVLVIGTATGAAIADTLAEVMPGTGSTVPTPQGESRTGATPGLAYGTVTDARGTGFTVVEGDGTRIPVTMSASSSVITTVPSGLGELRAGQMTAVVVSTGPDGALAAVTVEQGVLPAGALKALNEWPPPQRAVAPVPGPGKPGSRSSQGLPGSLSSSQPSPPLSVLLGGSRQPFASLGCDPSAVTSVDLLALALGS
jgi:hypothetical protein